MQIAPNLPKGMRDFIPEELLARQWVMNTIRASFERFGFSPLSTPAIERLEILNGKAGEESDSLTFKILKRGEGESSGEADLGLRYDLTVPLARFMAMHPETSLPFKRYQMERVWRAERPQRGRYREFIQCDADIVGSSSMQADAEIVALTNTILSDLGFSKFRIHINHRGLIDACMEWAKVPRGKSRTAAITIDKMDKIGMDGVREELLSKGLPEDVIDHLLELGEINGANDHRLVCMERCVGQDGSGSKALDETKEMFETLAAMDMPAERLLYDPFLIRGMGYYTGPVFESRVEEPKIGSITGGGRYDNLIGIFGNKPIPATGTTIGFERIMDVLREMGKLPVQKTHTHLLVTVFNREMILESVRLVTELRKAGLACELYLDPQTKLTNQLKYADERGIPLVAIVGPDELSQGIVTIRNLSTREQLSVPRGDVYWQVADILNL